jgi:hypothetical protein
MRAICNVDEKKRIEVPRTVSFLAWFLYFRNENRLYYPSNQVTSFHATVYLVWSELVSGITVLITIYYLILPLLFNNNPFSYAFFWVITGICILYADVSEHHVCHTYSPMKMGQSVPKCWHLDYRHQRFTQKKAHNIQNMAKVWNQEDFFQFNNWEEKLVSVIL